MTSLKITHYHIPGSCLDSTGELEKISTENPDAPFSRLATKVRELQLEYLIRCCSCAINGGKSYYWVDCSYEEPDHGIQVVRIGCYGMEDDLLIKERYISCVESAPGSVCESD
jgi:hypothetical protein